MATWTETFYKRVLEQLSSQELHHSYNCVVQEDLSNVEKSINEVIGAFGKLDEIRIAVSKLQGTKVSSTNLGTELEKTMALQKKLEEKLKLLTGDILQKKRKTRSESYSKTVDNSALKKAEKEVSCTLEADLVVEKKTKNKSKKRKKHGDDDHIHNSGLILEENIIDTASCRVLELNSPELKVDEDKSKASGCVVYLDKKDYLKVMGDITEWEVSKRNDCLPGILLELARVVNELPSGRLLQTGPMILKYVAVWALRSGAKGSLIKAFTSFVKAVNAPLKCLPQDRRAVGVTRVHTRLQSYLIDLKCRVDKSKAHSKGPERISTDYDILLWESNFMKPERRRKRVPQVIQALVTEMTQRFVTQDKPRGVARAVNALAHWAQRETRDSQLSKRYLELAQASKLYANKVPNFAVKAGLIADANRIELAIGRLASWTIRERTKQALDLVNELTETSPLDYLDTAILMVDEVIHFVEPKWNPRNELSVGECYQRLQELVEALEEGPIQQQRLLVLNKWRGLL